MVRAPGAGRRYLLGTAHLMAGAGRLDGPAMLQALAAYQQAEKLGIAIPDLFFNRPDPPPSPPSFLNPL